MCSFCSQEFGSVYNRDRHEDRVHHKVDDEEEEEGKSEESEQENDGWGPLIGVVYDRVITEEHKGMSADEILNSKPIVRAILVELREELHHISSSCENLENNDLYNNWKNSKEKFVDDEN
ncbi:MAG: hypothetical protein GY820_48265 [Gammaproteobacteria bacterium]|nr:hypothetical protein [Gammaproteobacteria bacterium]